MKKVLLIAFDFPPYQSSGVERTFKFAKYLRRYGWSPIVLTVNKNTYAKELTGKDELLEGITVYRTFCLDVSRHLSYKGKYFAWMKKPDRYIGWFFTAFPQGLKIIKKHQPDVIWSSYPIITSHFIAGMLAKTTSTPWVADYRDPLQCYYDKLVYNESACARWLDRFTVKNASKIVMVTDSAKELYQRIHTNIDKFKFTTIANGFDSSNLPIKVIENPNKLKFVAFHAGSLYETGRDPNVFFKAIRLLKNKKVISSSNFVLKLYGAHNRAIYQHIVDELNINSLVEFLEQERYQKSLSNMNQANLLLLVQGEVFDYQIPGKAYEYIATNKPVMVIAPETGETFRLMSNYDGCCITEDINVIAAYIEKEMAEPQEYKRNYSNTERLKRTKDLAVLLNQIISNP